MAKQEMKIQRVLVVAAHPDDPEFLFGATVADLVRKGADIYYLICSDGANGSTDAGISRTTLADIRRVEQEAAAKALGVREVRFLGFPDGGLTPDLELRKAIAREVRRVKPDVVIGHYPHRVLDIPIEASHPDHVAVGEATLSAVFPDAANARACPELQREGLAPHRVKEVWVAGYERPNFAVDAAPYLEQKVAAILCHKSQTGGNRAQAPPWVYEWMKWAGKRNSYEYAEEYKRISM
jgi:LmbE family N-acetylglucosaminyl deacetylase